MQGCLVRFLRLLGRIFVAPRLLAAPSPTAPLHRVMLGLEKRGAAGRRQRGSKGCNRIEKYQHC